METIIQAGNKHLRIASVPVNTNPKTRESRLFKNIFQHMFKSGLAIIRSFLMFKPHVPLGWMAFITGILGVVPFVRFLIYWVQGEATGHIQSLIFGSAMLVASLLSIAIIVITDLQKTNRILIEEALERIKEIQYSRAPEGLNQLREELSDPSADEVDLGLRSGEALAEWQSAADHSGAGAAE